MRHALQTFMAWFAVLSAILLCLSMLGVIGPYGATQCLATAACGAAIAVASVAMESLPTGDRGLFCLQAGAACGVCLAAVALGWYGPSAAGIGWVAAAAIAARVAVGIVQRVVERADEEEINGALSSRSEEDT